MNGGNDEDHDDEIEAIVGKRKCVIGIRDVTNERVAPADVIHVVLLCVME